MVLGSANQGLGCGISQRHPAFRNDGARVGGLWDESLPLYGDRWGGGGKSSLGLLHHEFELGTVGRWAHPLSILHVLWGVRGTDIPSGREFYILIHPSGQCLDGAHRLGDRRRGQPRAEIWRSSA